MKTTIKNNLAAALLMGAVAMSGLTACSSSDDSIAEEPIVNPAGVAKVYSVSIPASMGGDAGTRAVDFNADGVNIVSKFLTSDNVYLYNETHDCFACDDQGVPILLHPSDISADGKSCTLTADGLTFYDYKEGEWNEELYNMDEGEWVQVDITPLDDYSLLYQMSSVDTDVSGSSFFRYHIQDGTKADASTHDFAMATGIQLTLSGNTLTVDGVTLENQQSMFRQQLTFKNESGATVTPTITRMEIYSKNNALVGLYHPFHPSEPYRRFSINIQGDNVLEGNGTSNCNLYAAFAFHYDNEHPAAGDKLIVDAWDENGKFYYGEKSVPSGGFVNGKFYHGSMELQQMTMYSTTEMYSESKTRVRPDNGTYRLEENKYYHVAGTINGNVEGSGNVTLVMYGGSVINGCVTLTSNEESDPSIYLYNYATINHPGNNNTALKHIANNNGGYLSIYTPGSSLTINGDVEGRDIRLDEGSVIRVSGSIDASILQANGEGYIYQDTEDGYTVFTGMEPDPHEEPEPEPEPEP